MISMTFSIKLHSHSHILSNEAFVVNFFAFFFASLFHKDPS